MNKHIITSQELIKKLIDFIEQDEFGDYSFEVRDGYVPAPKLNYNSEPHIYPYLVKFESNYYIVEYIYSSFFVNDEGLHVNYDVELSHEVWMISEYDAKSIFVDSIFEDDEELAILRWNNWNRNRENEYIDINDLSKIFNPLR